MEKDEIENYKKEEMETNKRRQKESQVWPS